MLAERTHSDNMRCGLAFAAERAAPAQCERSCAIRAARLHHRDAARPWVGGSGRAARAAARARVALRDQARFAGLAGGVDVVWHCVARRYSKANPGCLSSGAVSFIGRVAAGGRPKDAPARTDYTI